jgi:uncharacterized protein
MANSFPPYFDEIIGHYVYRLVDPRDGETFYVGKGAGARIFEHVAGALSGDQSSLKYDRIRDIKQSGLQVIHFIHRHGLSEKESLEVEAALIDAYRLRDAPGQLTNLQSGHNSNRGAMLVDDLIAQYARDEAVFDIPVLLVKLNRQFERGLTSEELYERTRGHWVINPEAHPEVKHAMPVSVGGVIREVYRVHRWRQIDSNVGDENALRRRDPNSKSRTRFRWTFDGEVDTKLRINYFGKIATVVARTPNPIFWVVGGDTTETSDPRPVVLRLNR